MKKILSCFVAVLLIAGLVGCGGSKSGDAQDGGDATYTIRVGHVLPESHQTHITLDEVFKKEVEEKSNGRIKVEIYPNAQLGGDRKEVESVQLGSLEMCVPAGSVVVGFDQDWEVMDMPYLFESREMALKNLDGEFGKALSEHLKENGIVCLGFGENGLRHVVNNVKPVEKLEDMAGLKIRTLESPMQVSAFKTFGAKPTPIAFNELFTALQQKTVDGAEFPINIVYANKFYEVQQYISRTGHIYLTCPYLINKNFYESLPEDLQEVLANAVSDTIVAQREALAEDEILNTKKIEEAGVKINDLSPEEKQRFIDAVKPLYEEYKNRTGNKYMDLIVK